MIIFIDRNRVRGRNGRRQSVAQCILTIQSNYYGFQYLCSFLFAIPSPIIVLRGTQTVLLVPHSATMHRAQNHLEIALIIALKRLLGNSFEYEVYN